MTLSDAEDDQPSKVPNGSLLPSERSQDAGNATSLMTNGGGVPSPDCNGVEANNTNEKTSKPVLKNKSPHQIHSSRNCAMINLDCDNDDVTPMTNGSSASLVSLEGSINSTNAPESNHVNGETDQLLCRDQDLVVNSELSETTEERILDSSESVLSAVGDETTNEDKKERGTGSESIGMVQPLRDEGLAIPLDERLSRHENEAQQLSQRLRESMVRRQELQNRYQATRERLNNLKKHRMSIVNEERQLLRRLGAPENPYEDPIPGAATWTEQQLESAIIDFQGLRDKLVALHSVYLTKMRTTDESETEACNELQGKINQITSKKTQISNALSQMADLLKAKREKSPTGEDSVSNRGQSALSSESERISSSTSQISPLTSTIEGGSTGVNEAVEDDIPEVEGASVIGGESEIVCDNPDIVAKQRHLKDLKQKLNDMKKLLLLSQQCTDSTPMNDDNLIDSIVNPENEPSGNEANQDGASDLPLIESTIEGVNGEVIHLSEIERRNPLVASKYNQLKEAKKRLSKMEEIMSKIAEARQCGLSLPDVLTPENMAILNAAREEEGMHPIDPSEDRSCTTEEVQTRASSDLSNKPSVSNDTNGNRFRHNLDLNTITPCVSDESGDRFSSVHLQLNKELPKIHSVNEERPGIEKGAIKKQARELLCENVDSRIEEVLVLQEELKRKKNALESIMCEMGKSSLNFDNISDRNSDDTLERPSVSWQDIHHSASQSGARDQQTGQFAENVHNTIASDSSNNDFSGQPGSSKSYYGDRPARRLPQAPGNFSQKQTQFNLIHDHQYSLPGVAEVPPNCPLYPPASHQASSLQAATPNFETGESYHQNRRLDNNHIQRNNSNLANAYGTASSAPNLLVKSDQTKSSFYTPLSLRPKNSRYNGRSNQEVELPNTFSLNNLNIPPTNASQAKLNFDPSCNIPTGTWESFDRPQLISSPSLGAGTKVQNSVSFALSQLNQLQETISSLYSDLRAAEASVRQDAPPSASGYGPNAYSFPSAPAFPQPQPHIQPQNMYNLLSRQNMQGMNDNLSNSSSGQISTALQQCFSQLNQHTLEIQALSKQLQSLRCTRGSLSPSRRIQTDHRPSVRAGDERVPQNLTNNQGVIKNIRAKARSSSSSIAQHNRNAYEPEGEYGNFAYGSSPIDHSRRCGAVSTDSLPVNGTVANEETAYEERRENSRQFPFYETSGSEDIQLNEEDFMVEWGFLFDEGNTDREKILSPNTPSSTGGLETTGILNNQVLPGTRANNYWDNFRSYSRQNPLSSSKSNAAEQIIYSDNNTPSRIRNSMNNCGHYRQQHQPSWSAGKKNDAFKVTFSNISLNKSSDKNSYSSRSQNKWKSEKRQSDNGRRAVTEPSFSPKSFSNIISPVKHHFPGSYHKRDNRGDREFDAKDDERECHSVLPKLDVTSSSSRTFEEIAVDSNMSRSYDESINRLDERRSQDFPFISNQQPLSNKFPLRARNEKMQSISLVSSPAEGAVGGNDRPAATTKGSGDEVIREAESLMEKLSEQPFLAQLFKHASRITRGTDQQVALELLRELSHQRSEMSQSFCPKRRIISPHNQGCNISPMHSPNIHSKNKFSNKNGGVYIRERSLSISSSSDRSVSSEENEQEGKLTNKRDSTKKKSHKISKSTNFPPSDSIPSTSTHSEDAFVACSNSYNFSSQREHSSSSKSMERQHQYLHDPENDQYLLSEIRGEGDGGDSIHFRRSVQGGYLSNVAAASSAVPSKNIRNAPPVTLTLNTPESPSNRCNIPTKNHSSTPKKNPSSLRSNKRNSCNYYELKKESTPRRSFYNKNKEFIDITHSALPGSSDRFSVEILGRDDGREAVDNTVGSAADSHRAVPSRKEDRSEAGVEGLISSVVADIFANFESATLNPSDEFEPALIETVHQSVMKQVFYHASQLGLPFQYLFLVDSQLKRTLKNFSGKEIYDVREHLIASVIRILMREYDLLNERSIKDKSNQSNDSNKENNNCSRSSSNKFISMDRNSLINVFSPSSKTPRYQREEIYSTSQIPHGSKLNEYSIFELKGRHNPSSENKNISSSFDSVESEVLLSSSSNNLLTNNEHASKETGAISKNSLPNYKQVSQAQFCDKNRAVLGQSSDDEVSSNQESTMAFPESWTEQASVEYSENQYSVNKMRNIVGNSPHSCRDKNVSSSSNLLSTIGKSSSNDASNISTTERELVNKQNRTEVDQDILQPAVRADGMDILSAALPLDELAEADQSQDAVESSTSSYSVNVTTSFAASHDSSSSIRPHQQLTEHIVLEDGLDEVPIRLSNFSTESLAGDSSFTADDVPCDESNSSYIGAHMHRSDISNPTDEEDVSII